MHAKVAVVDDRWLIVGSANLNAHSFFNDTEMCVVTDDAALARDTRVRLWAEHLELDRGRGRRRARASSWSTSTGGRSPHEQLRRACEPASRPRHRLLELPGVSRRSRRLLGPLSGLIDDG